MNKTKTYRVNNIVGFKGKPESEYEEDSTFVDASNEYEAKELAMKKFKSIYHNVMHWRNYMIIITDATLEKD